MTATLTPPAVSIVDLRHAHTSTCYWDFREARWQCAATEPPAPARPGRAAPAQAPR